jgi:hypothetical protein
MNKAYMYAPDADRIAATLLATVHSDKAEVPVRCLFCSETPRKGGRVVLANIRKLTGLTAFLAGSVAVEGLQESLDLEWPISFQEPRELALIVISYDEWGHLTESQREALLDHELSHLVVDKDEDGNLLVTLRAHEVEEFWEVIHRHGDWKGEIAGFKKPLEVVALKQVSGGIG